MSQARLCGLACKFCRKEIASGAYLARLLPQGERISLFKPSQFSKAERV